MSDPITLVPKSDLDLTLPVSIATSSLTLAELGAIFCLASMPQHLASKDGGSNLAKRLNDPEFAPVAKKLMEKGLVEMSGKGRCLTIKLNLEKLCG